MAARIDAGLDPSRYGCTRTLRERPAQTGWAGEDRQSLSSSSDLLCPSDGPMQLPADRVDQSTLIPPSRLRKSMRTEQAVPVRLADYRAPDWLVETVDLYVSLGPTNTVVRSRLRLKPNPLAAAPAPVVLDGDELQLRAIKLDGETLAADAYVATPDGLTIPQPPPRAFVLDTETVPDPSANAKLMGLYRSRQTYTTQCEAEGFRRIAYFPDRPDGISGV